MTGSTFATVCELNGSTGIPTRIEDIELPSIDDIISDVQDESMSAERAALLLNEHIRRASK